MQIAETEILSLVYYNGIGIRNIQTAFNDGSAQKHVIIALDELHHLVFQFLGLHLTMSHTYPHVRHYTVQNVIDSRQFLHLVVKEKYLSATVQFIVDYITDFIFIEKNNLSLDRNPVRRGSADDGKVARPQ